MYKVFIIAAVVAMVSARPQGGDGHGHNQQGHGHAYSSQSVVLHQSHETQHGHIDNHQSNHHQQEEHKHEEVHGHHGHHHIDYYAHPKYEYAYEIKDPHTHDFKSQHEHRDGDVVVGEYSLHQPDGTIRIVKYRADKKTGFNADVKIEGHAQHIVPEHHHHH